MYFELSPEKRQPAKWLFKLLGKNLTYYDSLQKPRNRYGSQLDKNTSNNIHN